MPSYDSSRSSVPDGFYVALIEPNGFAPGPRNRSRGSFHIVLLNSFNDQRHVIALYMSNQVLDDLLQVLVLCFNVKDAESV